MQPGCIESTVITFLKNGSLLAYRFLFFGFVASSGHNSWMIAT
jgi:hypothetical protein